MTSSTKELSYQQALRYNRQIVLPGFDLEGQEKLLNSKVLLIGVGGVGCAAAQYLVASGVGQLTLVDFDKVEQSNLQRQILHAEQDIGKPKVASAKASLTALNDTVKITTLEQKLDDESLSLQVSKHDLVLDCTDNLASRNQINRACLQHHKPLVSGAAIRMEGQISCFIPAKGRPCYHCLSSMFGEQKLSCVESGIMSPVVGIVGAMQALEAIKIIANYGTTLAGNLLILDAKTSQWESFNIPHNPQCPSCNKSFTKSN